MYRSCLLKPASIRSCKGAAASSRISPAFLHGFSSLAFAGSGLVEGLSLLKEACKEEFCQRPWQHKSNGIKAKWSPVLDPVDTRSFPFAEKGFSSLKLSPVLLRRLKEEGLEVPTDVQVAAIPAILDGHDAAIQSYTGSGKTLAFLLPILSRIGPFGELEKERVVQDEGIKKGGVEVVIVAPSRELAMQIVREAERILGPDNHKVVQQLIGGANIKNQEAALKKNKPLIVVGTPGRISDVSRAGRLHTHGCRFLVLDEADQLLSLKFRDSMQRILEHVGVRRSPGSLLDAQGFLRPPPPVAPAVESEDASTGPGLGGADFRSSSGAASGQDAAAPKLRNRVERQTILVSATMPPAVIKAATKWGQKPLLVKATSVIEVEADPVLSDGVSRGEDLSRTAPPVPDSLPPNLEHFYIVSSLQHKVDTARKCIHALEARSALLFMNHGRTVKDVVFKLEARGIVAGALYGELSKVQRSNVLASFRSGKLRVLVCSEVGARGLDVPNCDLVINIELPTDGPHYAHRGGRTGRLGRKGTVISICEGSEEFVVSKFERQLGISISRCEAKEGKLVSFGSL